MSARLFTRPPRRTVWTQTASSGRRALSWRPSVTASTRIASTRSTLSSTHGPSHRALASPIVASPPAVLKSCEGFATLNRRGCIAKRFSLTARSSNIREESHERPDPGGAGRRIATVIFNRPEMRNAISLAMWTEIAEVTESCPRTIPSVPSSIAAPAGTLSPRAPTSRNSRSTGRTSRPRSRTTRQTEAAYNAIRVCPKPTVAMVFGFCMGGAMAVAMACDFRFAAERLEVRHPGRQAQHHLRAGSGAPARRPRRSRLREGHPLLGARGRCPGGASHRA